MRRSQNKNTLSEEGPGARPRGGALVALAGAGMVALALAGCSINVSLGGKPSSPADSTSAASTSASTAPTTHRNPLLDGEDSGSGSANTGNASSGDTDFANWSYMEAETYGVAAEFPVDPDESSDTAALTFTAPSSGKTYGGSSVPVTVLDSYGSDGSEYRLTLVRLSEVDGTGAADLSEDDAYEVLHWYIQNSIDTDGSTLSDYSDWTLGAQNSPATDATWGVGSQQVRVISAITPRGDFCSLTYVGADPTGEAAQYFIDSLVVSAPGSSSGSGGGSDSGSGSGSGSDSSSGFEDKLSA